ncbi:hypothetical protein [Flavitalea sp.]|nr:hypothetical protein [Flavitalea sp.]
MSLSQSYLVQPGYYDMVASVTQKALNNAIETYYDDTHTFSAVSFYFINNGGTPLQVALSGIKDVTTGVSIDVDPLSGTAKLPLTQAQINTIKSSNLWFAFNMYIGNPAGYSAAKYLTINPGINAVDYYLLCRTLHVAFWNPDKSTWTDILQTAKEEFNINATVNLQTVISSNNITEIVQNGIDYIMSTYNLSSTDLNIQQLLFDADSAVVSPSGTLTGLDSSCSVFIPLMQQFAKSYFSTYLAQAPALDYAVTQTNTSSLLPTSMSLFAGAFVDSKGNAITNPTEDQQDLATLNYLFSTGGEALNAGKQFNWNFLDDNGTSHNPDLDTNADVNKYDGAIAIKRDAFAKYLDSQLQSYVLGNCWTPVISVGADPVLQYEYDVDIKCDTYASFYGLQQFDETQVMMGSPDTLVLYLHTATDSATGWSADDTMKVTTHFQLMVDVDTTKQTLTVTQNLWISVAATGNPKVEDHTPYNGSPVYKTFTDTFSFVVDQGGNMCLTNTNSQVQDTSDKPANIPQYVSDALSRWVAWIDAADFKQLPVIMPIQFVFPGGNAFTFKDAQFSDTSDLVCHIKYLAES